MYGVKLFLLTHTKLYIHKQRRFNCALQVTVIVTLLLDCDLWFFSASFCPHVSVMVKVCILNSFFHIYRNIAFCLGPLSIRLSMEGAYQQCESTICSSNNSPKVSVSHQRADLCGKWAGSSGCRHHGGKLNIVHLHILPTFNNKSLLKICFPLIKWHSSQCLYTVLKPYKIPTESWHRSCTMAGCQFFLITETCDFLMTFYLLLEWPETTDSQTHKVSQSRNLVCIIKYSYTPNHSSRMPEDIVNFSFSSYVRPEMNLVTSPAVLRSFKLFLTISSFKTDRLYYLIREN